VPLEQLESAGRERFVRFRSRNVFFGGVQAVERDPETGAVEGAGDPRRGGVAVTA
jgi:gamma-glutamyltranspeptidase / glutathione hydrolase